MAYFGAAAIVIAVYIIWREYAVFLDGELSWCRCFLSALTDYRDKVRCYVETPRAWARDYSDARLSGCGFLDLITSGADFLEAYRECARSPYLTEATDSALSECFDRLGRGYIDTELEVLGIAIDKLTVEEHRLAESLAKRRKALGATLGAVVSGIVILIM